MIVQKAKGIHIDGRKSMSKELPLQDYLNPQFVYIHLLRQTESLKRVVEVGEYVRIGQVVALREGWGPLPIHASVSGTVTAVKKVWHSSGKMVDAIEIKNDFLGAMDDSITPEKDPSSLTKEQLVEKMKQAGLSGLGGAGFPTFVKYQSKLPINTVIINAVECEPYITSDYMMIDRYPEKLLKGLHYMMASVGATRGVVAYKAYNSHITDVLTPFLPLYPGIEIYLSKDIYPAGWEKYLIQQITKKTYNSLPSEAGAIVNNAQTAMVFADMVEHNVPLIARGITITGEGIKQPRNFLVPIGTPVKDLIEQCGGYIDGLDSTKTNYIAGGPMTGRAILIDDLIVNDTLGSVIIRPIPDPKLSVECMGCGKCADACPVFLTPTEIWHASERGDIEAVKRLKASKCMGCGLCSHVCPSHIDITDFVDKAKALIRKGA
ncbi:MAG: RnfABCDGE type electron transport complex subunit C [Candidatus Izemoplasmatales bacterium]|nr:RnfABCDGE type electron transport complex subunit C [bacterium]MDZ4196568.1 RnfABCDGE type electron transport complex subunit C [Candidatus Izemoplasmatales bacterium]